MAIFEVALGLRWHYVSTILSSVEKTKKKRKMDARESFFFHKHTSTSDPALHGATISLVGIHTTKLIRMAMLGTGSTT